MDDAVILYIKAYRFGESSPFADAIAVVDDTKSITLSTFLNSELSSKVTYDDNEIISLTAANTNVKALLALPMSRAIFALKKVCDGDKYEIVVKMSGTTWFISWSDSELLSANTKQGEELADKLDDVQGVVDALTTEMAESKGSQADLLNHVNRILESLDEKYNTLSNELMAKTEQLSKKDYVLSHVTDEKNELVRKLATTQGPKSHARELNTLQEHLDEKDKDLSRMKIEKKGLVQKLAKATGQNNLMESEVQQAQAAAAVAESTVVSLRSTIEKLRREKKSLQDQVNQSRDSFSGEEKVNEVDFPSTPSINFDDITTMKIASVPNGYRGLNWEHFGLIHSSMTVGGYEYAIVSGDYLAVNESGSPCCISSTEPFTVDGFQATAAWRKGLNVLVESFDQSGSLVGSYQTTLGNPRDGPTFIDLRREGKFEGLYKLEISSSGGTSAGLGNGKSAAMAMDHMQAYSNESLLEEL